MSLDHKEIKIDFFFFSPYFLVSFLYLWKHGYYLRHKGNYSYLLGSNPNYYQHFCFCVPPFY